jgi:hypothetical protein
MKRSTVRAGVWTALAVLLLAVAVLPFLGFASPMEGWLDAKRDYGCADGSKCAEGTFCQQEQCVPIFPSATGEPEGV